MGNAVRNISDLKSPKKNRKYSIIIPAASISNRMKKYGPKPLINIDDNTTILDKQLEIINKTFRWFEVIIIGGFEFKKLKKYENNNIKIIENKNYKDTSVISSIDLGLKQKNTNSVLIIYGDLVFNYNTLQIPIDNESGIIIADNIDKKNEIGCNIQNNYVEQMFYGLNNKWSQISFFQNKELEIFEQLCGDTKNHFLYHFELINATINNGGKIKAWKPSNCKVLDIDSFLDLRMVKNIL